MVTTSAPAYAPDHSHTSADHSSCLNCGQTVHSRFCPDCGQRIDTHRINWHYLGHDVLHSVWHLDGGIVFTLKELITRPGHSIREFLAGKRANHYRPLSLLLLLGAILLFVTHALDISFVQMSQDMFHADTNNASERLKAFQAQVAHFIESKQNLVHIITIPLYAFWVWVLFKRRGFNYPEFLVVQTFIANVQLLVSLVAVVLFWMIGASGRTFALAMSLSLFIYMGYNAYTYTQLFAGKMRPLAAIARSITAYFLGYFSIIFIGIIVGVVYGLIIFLQEKTTLKNHTNKPAVTVQHHQAAK